MNILVISHLFPSESRPVYGLFINQYVEALATLQDDINVIAPVPWTPGLLARWSPKYRQYFNSPYHRESHQYSVHYCRYVTFPKAWFHFTSGVRLYLSIRKYVYSLSRVQPFDIIHAHVALPAGFAAVLLGEMLGVPTVVTIHGADFQSPISQRLLNTLAIKWTLQKADTVTVVSTKLRQMAKTLIATPKNIHIIHNGMNLYQVHHRIRNNNKMVILSVSNLLDFKGIDLNLQALKKIINLHKDVHYIIIGEGPDRKRLEHLVSELEIEPYVSFRGACSHEEVMEAMAACDIFSMPSWNESFGVVYLEAMATGKPVIGCSGQGIEDFVENGYNGILVQPKDSLQLFEKLSWLIENPIKRKEIGIRARNTVVKNFRWSSIGQQYQQLFVKTIKKYRSYFGANNRTRLI